MNEFSPPVGVRWWRRAFRTRRRYGTMERRPFYELAGSHLPQDLNATVLDVGCGDAGFAEQLGLAGRFQNLWLLDGNPTTVSRLRQEYRHVVEYHAPSDLPFSSASADFIHCSHMIEHLHINAFYRFLQEVDRVLKPGGTLVVSTPLLWDCFYADLSHVRPYNPEVFVNYLSKARVTATAFVVSEAYTVVDLVYREKPVLAGSELAATNAFMDFTLQLVKSTLYRLGIRRYVRNGYTLVVRKASG